MHLMYVDESGDPGPQTNVGTGNSPHFILSGLILPVDEWQNCLNRVKDFRRTIRKEFGLPERDEIHAAELIRVGGIESYWRIRKSRRIEILRRVIQEIPEMLPCARVLNVCFDKKKRMSDRSVKEVAWSRLIQRYDRFLRAEESFGLIIADGTEDFEVRRLLRKMRVFNYVPSRYGKPYRAEVTRILEDPIPRDSRHSYFVQLVDSIAHSLYRQEYPKGRLSKFRLERLFATLDPVLLKEASRDDPQGIVRK